MPRVKEFEPQAAVGDAMAVFWEEGYEAASVQDLLDAMGINRGSMYDTFGDKRSLFLDALEQYAARWLEELVSDLERAATPLSGIDRLLRSIARCGGSHRGCLLVNTAVESGGTDAEIARIVRRALARMERAIRATLKAAVAAGELPARTDIVATARYLQTIIFGLRVAAKAGLPRASKDDTVSAVMAALRRRG